MTFTLVTHERSLYVCIWLIGIEILYFDSLSPSHFYLQFRFEARRRRKKKKENERKDVVVLLRQVSVRMFACSCYLFRRVEKKFEKNKTERKKKMTKLDLLLLKYKITIWPIHFFFFFFHRYSLAYSCLLSVRRYFAPITWTTTMTTEVEIVQAHIHILNNSPI